MNKRKIDIPIIFKNRLKRSVDTVIFNETVLFIKEWEKEIWESMTSLFISLSFS